jgi:hypothetical protein
VDNNESKKNSIKNSAQEVSVELVELGKFIVGCQAYPYVVVRSKFPIETFTLDLPTQVDFIQMFESTLETLLINV